MRRLCKGHRWDCFRKRPFIWDAETKPAGNERDDDEQQPDGPAPGHELPATIDGVEHGCGPLLGRDLACVLRHPSADDATQEMQTLVKEVLYLHYRQPVSLR